MSNLAKDIRADFAPGENPSVETAAGWLRQFGKVGMWILAAATVALIGFRALMPTSHGSETLAQKLTAGSVVLRNDAVIFAAIALCAYSSFLARIPRGLAVALRSLALALLFFYATDVLVISSFTTHLMWHDVVKYLNSGPQYAAYLLSLMPIPLRLLMLMLGLMGMGGVCRFLSATETIKSRRLHVGCWGIVAMFVAFYAARPPLTPATNALTLNVFDYNRIASDSFRPYTPAFIAELDRTEFVRNVPGANRQPNIILLAWESLSCYQSKHFMGDRNWTPELDRLARENMAFRSFYANSFCSEDGAIAMLTGCLPFAPPPSRPRDNIAIRFFEGFHGYEQSLPRVLRKHGYTCEFQTGGDLRFSGQGKWMESLGFQCVEGSTSPAYAKLDRGFSDAPPDEFLLSHVVDRVRENTDSPYFAYVTTSTSHPPWQCPTTGQTSEQQCFEYVDRAVAAFVKQLEAAGYFENGILIITSDHRAMVPLTAGESQRTSEPRASHWVPMVMLGAGISQQDVQGSFQQTDIYQTICNLVSRQGQVSDWRGDCLTNTPPRYIGCRRGNRRDIATVMESSNDILVKLDGDRTRVVVAGESSDATVDEVVRRINMCRTRGRNPNTPRQNDSAVSHPGRQTTAGR